MSNNNRVLVAMSGGVDSTVAAAILKSQGLAVSALHLDFSRSLGVACRSIDSTGANLISLKKICLKLDIPLIVVDVHDLFDEKVLDHAIHEMLHHRFPVPCMRCNQFVKIGALADKADQLGFSKIATGHYAQIARDPASGTARLLKAAENASDQTYYLFGFPQRILQKTLMPLGALPRAMVRKLAQELEVPTVDRSNAPNACFLHSDEYCQAYEDRVLSAFRPDGTIKTTEGIMVGTHKGVYRYYPGRQMQKGEIAVDKPEAYYVVGSDPEGKTLFVSSQEQALNRKVVLNDLKWVGGRRQLKGFECKGRSRANQPEELCHVTLFENSEALIEFEEPQRGLFSGQPIVFYQDDEVLGGGIIGRVVRS